MGRIKWEDIGNIEVHVDERDKDLAAIDAIGERPMVWNENDYELGARNQYDADVLALETVPSVQPEPQWIPCSERLPDTPHYYEEDGFRESDFILIYTKINDIENESNIYVAQYCIDDGDKTGYFVVPFCADTFREGVTAWMPLPKPYKAESEG